jgi:ABC-type dipeptide/oligopeptide/nickel transport system permease component
MRRSRYLLNRLAFAVLTVFVAVTFNFLLLRLMPGDPTSRLARIPNATQQTREALVQQFGLDKPLWQQYYIYLRELMHANLGLSFQDQQPVTGLLLQALGNTLPMVTLGTVVAIILGLLTGPLAAWWRGNVVEKLTTFFSMLFYSLPTQWLGLMFIFIFSVSLGWFPSAGMHDPGLSAAEQIGIPVSWGEKLSDTLLHMVLPSMTLALVLFGEYTLLVRSALLETFGEDFILTARAKGLRPRRVLFKHAFRNALLPVVTLVALSFGFIAGGSILIETVFSWPGIGLLSYEAILARDYPLIQGAFLVITISVVFFNLLADILYFKLDPRITQ